MKYKLSMVGYSGIYVFMVEQSFCSTIAAKRYVKPYISKLRNGNSDETFVSYTIDGKYGKYR